MDPARYLSKVDPQLGILIRTIGKYSIKIRASAFQSLVESIINTQTVRVAVIRSNGETLVGTQKFITPFTTEAAHSLFKLARVSEDNDNHSLGLTVTKWSSESNSALHPVGLKGSKGIKQFIEGNFEDIYETYSKPKTIEFDASSYDEFLRWKKSRGEDHFQ